MTNRIKTSTLQNVFRVLLGCFMLFAGIGHFSFLRADFQSQVPDWIPLEKDFVVLASGAVEICFGLSMIFWLNQKTKVGLALALFFILIFPGNIAQYLNGSDAFGALNSDATRLRRLFYQPVLILWALWSTGAWKAWRTRNQNS